MAIKIGIESTSLPPAFSLNDTMTKHLLDCRLFAFFLLTAFLLTAFIPVAISAQEQPSVADDDDETTAAWLLPVPELQPDDQIPTSEQVLRYGWGDDVSSHYQIETYLRALAQAAPDRTRLVQYGESFEGRSLNYLVISSAENIARLEEIRAGNLKLADPRGYSPGEATSLIENGPAIVWLAYAVHGNEISPSDAALLTAYHLLADRREETRQLLNQLVVVIDPLQNPDGRDRFVNVFRETRGRFMQSNPYSNEHTERWPGGRSNHYWFDMNRDWFRHSQREVKAKVAAYLQWQPQLYVDAHEMGRNSTFFFPPPTDPKNPYLLPQQNQWFSQLGRYQAGWFDRYGFGYMTREVFDAFYPGYGSEWPTLQGGLGILWEQASARGLVIDRDDETELTYADGVRHHYISGLATVEFAAQHRKELLDSFYQARLRGVQLGQEGDVRHYFLLRKGRPQRADELATMLVRNGIEVRVVRESIEVTCSDIKNDLESTRSIPAGSFHLPVAQPASRLMRALLDRRVEMDEKFLRRQLERNELRLPDEIYDVTAWSMPLAFDVTCLASGHDADINSETWYGTKDSGDLDLEPAQVAYLIPGTDGAVQAMSQLLQQGVRIHVSDESFKLGGRRYDRGTLIAKVADNNDQLQQRLNDAANQFHIEVVPTDTAFVEEGAHMGGPHVHWVRPPKILLVVNRPTNYTSGHTWYLFDQVLNYPTTRINGRDFGRVDLSKYNTLVLPDGRYSPANGFDDSRSQALAQWISAGGTLITLRGATEWAASEKVGLIKNQMVRRKVETPVKTDENDAEPQYVAPDNVPGAFFRAQVFQKHWVTFGFDAALDVFYTGRIILSPTSETAGRSLVTFADKENLLTSGFCWPESLQLLADTPFVVYRPMGRGHVIAFTDDPNFRAMYPSLQRLFINAAMFGAAH